MTTSSPPRVQVDDVARDRAEVDDLADDAGLARAVVVVAHDRIFSGRIVNRRPSRSRTFEVPTKPATNSVAGCS